MDFGIPDEYRQMKDTTRRFVADVLRPAERTVERQEIIDDGLHRELVAEARRYGLWNAFVPEKWGGSGILDMLPRTLIREELGATSYVLRSYVDNSVPIDLDDTSEYQRERYFLPALAGDKRWFAGITEPGAGSDNGAMTTRATQDGTDWVLNGQKHFISGVDTADFGLIYAVTDPSKRKHGGISAFIVEKGMPGFTVGPRQVMMGHRGFNQYVLYFDDCRVPQENMLGGAGGGLRQFLSMIVGARLKVAAEAIGAAQYAHDLGVDYTKQREVLGSRLIDKQGIQWMLIDAMVALQGARLMTYEAAWKADQGQDIRVEASMAKMHATEVAWRVIDTALQVHGGLGYTEDLPLARLLRDIRGARIYEGANELQRYVISKALWGVGQ
jgi:alkylation response protein AidB-like acyl-CoA dehydrogenase